MQLPVEVRTAPNIIEINIDAPLSNQDIDILLQKLQATPEIDTFWLISGQPNTIITDAFATSLIKLLEKTLQITRVIYKNCDIPAKLQQNIEKQLLINKNLLDQSSTTTEMTLEVDDLATLQSTLIKFSNTLRLKLACGEVKKIVLQIDHIDLASIENVVHITNFCDQFSELIGLKLRFKEMGNFKLIKILPYLKALFIKFELLTIQLPDKILEQGVDNTYKTILGLLSHATKLKELKLSGVSADSAPFFEELLTNNTTLESLIINFKFTSGCCQLVDLKLGLDKNTKLQNLEISAPFFHNDERIKLITDGLKSHPNIVKLRLQGHLSLQGLIHLGDLIRKNQCIQMFHLHCSLPEENFAALCRSLNCNRNIQELTLCPISLREDVVKALSDLLNRNHSLRTLNLVGGSDQNNPYNVVVNDECIKSLCEKITSPLFLQKINLYINVESIDTEHYKKLVQFILKFFPQLKHLMIQGEYCEIDPKLEVGKKFFNFGELDFKNVTGIDNLEYVTLERCFISKDIQDQLIENKDRNGAVTAIESAEKYFKLTSNFPVSSNIPQEYLPYSSSTLPASKAVKDKGSLLLGRSFLAACDQANAYTFFRECDFHPSTMLEMVTMLFGENQQLFENIAAGFDCFRFSKTELLQFFLIMLMYCDITDTSTLILRDNILKILQKPGHEAAGLSSQSDAIIPIRYKKLMEIVSEIKYPTPYYEEVNDVFSDNKLSYPQRFKLLRAHPMVVPRLREKFGTALIICFEDLIVNYLNLKTAYNPSETWEVLYAQYQEKKYSNDSDKDFDKIEELQTRLFKFFDYLYLTNNTRKHIETDSDLNLLIALASKGNFPWLNNLIASVYTLKKNEELAVKFYLAAAEQGDFSAIDNIKVAATKLEPWAITILASDIYLRNFPELHLFLADCYEFHGDIENMLKWYKRALVHFTKTVIYRVQKLAIQYNGVIAFLCGINEKPVSLLIFLGNFYAGNHDYQQAMKYYKLADPENNAAAYAGIESIASRSMAEAITCMASLSRKYFEKYPQDPKLLKQACLYNFHAAKLKDKDSIAFLKLITNYDLPGNCLYLIAGIMQDQNEMSLAKSLLLRAKDENPLAKLEYDLDINSPSKTEKEKCLDFFKGGLVATQLKCYFKIFSQYGSATQQRIAYAISRYFEQHNDLDATQALNWLREEAINPISYDAIKGELARMLAYAIYWLKDCKMKAAVPVPGFSVNPLTKSYY